MNEENKELTPEQHRVLREGGTEMAFTGEHYKTKDKGMYACVGCGQQLFSSGTKFDSGTGWPSFDDALPGAVEFKEDGNRTEVVCSKCGGHLGHVFDDGPKETTGKRYCINSVCLDLQKEE